jgi:hypothetical protein
MHVLYLLRPFAYKYRAHTPCQLLHKCIRRNIKDIFDYKNQINEQYYRQQYKFLHNTYTLELLLTILS